MERKTLFSLYVNEEALELQERLWEESAAFFRNFKIKESLGLEGFENLIFEASFAGCLAKKRAREEHIQYPLLKLIPQRFRPSGGVFQKTAALLELNVLQYIEEYQESLKKEEKLPGSIMMAAHFLSSVYLENLSKGKERLRNSISAAIKRVIIQKKTAQE